MKIKIGSRVEFLDSNDNKRVGIVKYIDKGKKSLWPYEVEYTITECFDKKELKLAQN